MCLCQKNKTKNKTWLTVWVSAEGIYTVKEITVSAAIKDRPVFDSVSDTPGYMFNTDFLPVIVAAFLNISEK